MQLLLIAPLFVWYGAAIAGHLLQRRPVLDVVLLILSFVAFAIVTAFLALQGKSGLMFLSVAAFTVYSTVWTVVAFGRVVRLIN